LNEIRYAISSHTENEMMASCSLVTESFGPEMGIAYEKRYKWQFLENPAGPGIILLAYDGEKVVGQITSIPGKYVFMNNIFATAIAGEWLCVSPEYRGRGIMSQLIQRRTKMEDDPFPFALDCPNNKSMRGFMKNGFNPMPIKQLIRPVKLSNCFAYRETPRKILKPFDKIWKKGSKIDNDESLVEEFSSPFDKAFDELFEDTKNENMIRQVRNAEFLNWRYRNVPGRDYKTIVSKGEDGKLRGYIVIKLHYVHGIHVGFIMDLLSKDLKAGKSLVRHALRYQWDNDVALSTAISFPNYVEYKSLRSEGFHIWPTFTCPSPVTPCIKTFNREQFKLDVQMLLDPKRWFFTFGDLQVN
jgi:GNAT superfamily N-acetyltransferase